MSAFASLALGEFLLRDPAELADRLSGETALRNFSQRRESVEAWRDSLGALRLALREVATCFDRAVDWRLLLEYPLLRRERRIDAVLVAPQTVFAIEFKQASRFRPEDARQAMDYALDLVDFHPGCRAVPVVPILCATEAAEPPLQTAPLLLPGAAPEVLFAGRGGLGALLCACLAAAERTVGAVLDPDAWERQPYRPTPTIIEAATMLYGRARAKDVKAARADAANLTRTTDRLRAIVAEARTAHRHAVCFVTGVPGAGKTLCGLNAVFAEIGTAGAAFLSGNRPLVRVLQEALAQDERERTGCRIEDARRKSSAAIQNLMGWLDNYLDREAGPPVEHVIVFDEAQRAWDAEFGWRKFRRRDAEAALVLDIMARHRDWAVVIALVGQGQEINTGEAGLAEWGHAIARGWVAGDPLRFWQVYAAPPVLDPAAPAPRRLFAGTSAYPPGVVVEDALDLKVSIRALRAAAHADWVEAVLADEPQRAAAIAVEHSLEIGLTRDLAALRARLRRFARGERRCGLVASSGARRLRAEGLGAQITEDGELVNWFLAPHGDIRSSNALEVVATEFACQGLELDAVGLCWGGDVIRGANGVSWRFRALVGNGWHEVRRAAEREWIRNTYRVLLTRARYETVIWVPRGDPADHTRPPAEMDAVAVFLRDCGARPLDESDVPVHGARESVLFPV